MTAGTLLALATVLAAVANHGRRRWQGPESVPWGDWSRRWTWILSAAVLLVGGAVGAHCSGAP